MTSTIPQNETSVTGSLSPTELCFCPKGNTAQVVERKDFSEEKRKQILELHKLNKRWNLVIPLHFILWFLGGWIALLTDQWILTFSGWVIAGVSLSALSVLAHESSHNLFTRKPRVDRWIGFLCGVPILFSTAGYRVMHSMHHKRVRTEDDPDDIENVTRNANVLRIVYILILFFGVYVFLYNVPVGGLKRGSTRERRDIVTEGLVMVGIVVIGWLFLPMAVMVNGWLLPVLIAGFIANIRGLAEHGFTSQGNEMVDTRTVATHPVVSFLMCNINYHLEHHLYPGVPWYNLPKLHILLQQDYRKAGSSVYRSYTSFMLDSFRAIKAGAVPGKRLIPNHLREELCL